MFAIKLCGAIYSVQQTKIFIGQKGYLKIKCKDFLSFDLYYIFKCPSYLNRLIKLFRSNYLVNVSERYFF